MGGMSMGHWIIVLIIVILLFGAKKIPELAKGLGKGIKTFKKEMDSDEVDSDETQADVKQVKSTEKKCDENVKATKTTEKTEK